MRGIGCHHYSELDRHAMHILLVMERRFEVVSVRFHADCDEAPVLSRFDEHQDRLPARLDGLVQFRP